MSSLPARLLERVRLQLDDSRRVQMTQLGYEALDGDIASAIEGLEGIERDARSRAVRGWANAGQAFILLSARRQAEAEATFARHPEPSSQPLLGLAFEMARGRLDPAFAIELSDCRHGISTMGVARVVVDTGFMDDVVKQSLELRDGGASGALLALQAGLHLLQEFGPAIRVGELLWERQHWGISAYWVAVAWAATGDATSAVTWLNRAADSGFSSLRALDREVQLDQLRRLPDFIAAREKVSRNPRRSEDDANGGLLWSRR
jgi:hypothetical protein